MKECFDMAEVSASFLSADFLELNKEIKRCESAGCRYIHIDVMDGNYVDNLAIGVCVTKCLAKGTSLRLDAHMAVLNPMGLVDAFADAGIDTYMFHPETCYHHYRLIDKIRKSGMKVGVVLTPTSPISIIKHFIKEIDVIDQLAVDVGFPHQVFRSEVYCKLRDLMKLKLENGYNYEIQVDGGINDDTAKLAINAGAETLIVGSWLFENQNMGNFVNMVKSY